MRLLVVLFIATVTVSMFAIAGLGASEIEISPETGFDGPSQTLTVDGDEFTVSELGQVTAGETLEIHATGPNETQYRLNIYDSSQVVQDFQSVTGSETIEFETTYFEPGTYMVAAVDSDNEYRDLLPVVVSSHEATVSVEEEVSNDDEQSVTVELEEVIEGTTVHGVELVLWNEDGETRVSMERESASTYQATMSTLAPGEYTLYAAVQREAQIEGEDDHELIGLSDPHTVTVIEASPNETQSQNEDTPTPTPDTPTPTPDTPTPETSTPTPESDSVLTPSNDSDTESTDADGPGFGLLTVVLSVVGGVLLLRAWLTNPNG